MGSSEVPTGPDGEILSELDLTMKISVKNMCSDIEMDKMFGAEKTNTMINTKSGEMCRAKCQTVSSCEYWSWESATSECNLFTSKSVTDTPGVLSGEKICKGSHMNSQKVVRHLDNLYLLAFSVELLECKKQKSTKKVFGSKADSSVNIPAVSLDHIEGIIIG